MVVSTYIYILIVDSLQEILCIPHFSSIHDTVEHAAWSMGQAICWKLRRLQRAKKNAFIKGVRVFFWSGKWDIKAIAVYLYFHLAAFWPGSRLQIHVF